MLFATPFIPAVLAGNLSMAQPNLDQSLKNKLAAAAISEDVFDRAHFAKGDGWKTMTHGQAEHAGPSVAEVSHLSVAEVSEDVFDRAHFAKGDGWKTMTHSQAEHAGPSAAEASPLSVAEVSEDVFDRAHFAKGDGWKTMSDPASENASGRSLARESRVTLIADIQAKRPIQAILKEYGFSQDV